MKFDDTPSREEREDFWLDLGPASAYEGLDCCETSPPRRRRQYRTALPMASKGPKARKTSWPPPETNPRYSETGAASAAPAESAGVAGHDGQPR